MSNKIVVAVLVAAACVILTASYLSCDSPTGSSNNPPFMPSGPSPADGSTGVPADTPLQWWCLDPDNDSLYYFLCLGTESEPPPVAKGVAKPLYQPRLFSLKPLTTYYWRVILDDSRARTKGPVWKFTTADYYCRHLPVDVGNKWVYAVDEWSRDGEEPPDVKDATEYTYEVTKHKGEFNEADAYVVEVTEYGTPVSEFYLAPYGDNCYLYTGDHWAFVVEDDLELHGGNERGLISSLALEYTGDGAINLPAGSFPQCKVFYRYDHDGIPFIYDNNDYYWEYYAPDTGVVYYKHSWQYVTWVLFIPIIREGEKTYELASYEVKGRSDANEPGPTVRAPAGGRRSEPLPLSAVDR